MRTLSLPLCVTVFWNNSNHHSFCVSFTSNTEPLVGLTGRPSYFSLCVVTPVRDEKKRASLFIILNVITFQRYWSQKVGWFYFMVSKSWIVPIKCFGPFLCLNFKHVYLAVVFYWFELFMVALSIAHSTLNRCFRWVWPPGQGGKQKGWRSENTPPVWRLSGPTGWWRSEVECLQVACCVYLDVKKLSHAVSSFKKCLFFLHLSLLLRPLSLFLFLSVPLAGSSEHKQLLPRDLWMCMNWDGDLGALGVPFVNRIRMVGSPWGCWRWEENKNVNVCGAVVDSHRPL